MSRGRRVRCFPPIEDGAATVLVLGSMPGEASLRAGEYYAHPRNAFWPIVAEVLGFPATAAYAEQILALKAARIAVWDVLASCSRPGSADADIDDGSIEVNDFAGLFRRNPGISRVFFNGAKAESCYRRHVLPDITRDSTVYFRLPSTSPANASMTFASKLSEWAAIRSSARNQSPT